MRIFYDCCELRDLRQTSTHERSVKRPRTNAPSNVHARTLRQTSTHERSVKPVVVGDFWGVD